MDILTELEINRQIRMISSNPSKAILNLMYDIVRLEKKLSILENRLK